MSTNGHIRFEENGAHSAWIVERMKPHVSMRFKKMFGGIPEGTVPPFRLRDRPDTAVDLDWFMSRYPLEISAQDQARLAERVRGHAVAQDRIGEILHPDYTPPCVSGFRDGEAPLPYQVRAAQMLRETGSLLLLDDVGLGKTISSLAAFSDGWGLPVAVVVQPHLSTQWVRNYIERFTHLKACEIKDRNPRALPPADIYVLRYSNIDAWVDALSTRGIETVVFDEIQEIRHGLTTKKGAACNALANMARNRLGLTATPVYNYGSEIWNIVERIRPGALGTWFEFLTNWCRQHGNHWLVADPEALGAYLQEEGISLRRTSEDPDVQITTPGLSKEVIEVEWSEDDARSDRELQARLAQQVLSGTFMQRGRAARELDMMLRKETGVAKARSVAAYTRMIVEAGEPVLLGGWHHDVYEIWRDMLGDLCPAFYTGNESTKKKREAELAFTSGETDLLIMSNRSGAGIDGLQERCAHAVAGEFDFSPQVHVQFNGRLNRYGQTRPVTSHNLFVEGGSDPVIMGVLGLKASQSHGILNPYGGAPIEDMPDEGRVKEMARAVLERAAAPQVNGPGAAVPSPARDPLEIEEEISFE